MTDVCPKLIERVKPLLELGRPEMWCPVLGMYGGFKLRLTAPVTRMSSRSAREDTALQNLKAWDGLARLDPILYQVRSRPNFFLTVPRILRVEGVHSDMLWWLLDPKGWHGLADRFAVPFVRAMLAACGLCSEVALVVEEVHREFSTGRGPDRYPSPPSSR